MWDKRPDARQNMIRPGPQGRELYNVYLAKQEPTARFSIYNQTKSIGKISLAKINGRVANYWF